MQKDPRNTARFAVPQPVEPAIVEAAPTPQPKNLVWAHAMCGVLLGILFAVAITAPVRPGSQSTTQAPAGVQKSDSAHESNAVHADAVAPAIRDLGSFTSGNGGLKGHLTASWSEKLTYHLVMGPDDSAQAQAFSAAVSNPPSPISVNVQLKNAGGQSLCDQQVMLKYDPRKWLKTSVNLDRAEAQELERERAGDLFQNNPGKDGAIESISAQGTMPCSKPDFDTVAAWSFTSHFPDLRAQENRLEAAMEKPARVKELADSARAESVRRAIHKSDLATAATTPAAPATLSESDAATPEPAVHHDRPEVAADRHEPASYTYQVEGDDDIVAFDAEQKSIQTSAGNTFYIEGKLAMNDADGTVGGNTLVHYRCDQTSKCTLFFSDSTVMHATKGAKWSASQATELSMVVVPAAGPAPVASSVPGLAQVSAEGGLVQSPVQDAPGGESMDH